MTKLLVMTDLHLTPGAERIIGLDPLERLLASLDHAAETHADAERLILSGDLTHYGDRESYQKLRDALTDRPWPVSFLMGNHDQRGKFRDVFPESPVDPDGFVQSVVDTGPLRIITLDSLDQDDVVLQHAGHLCDRRLDWLEAQLVDAGETPCLVFLHHPPFRSGFSGMDDIRLLNDDAFADVLSKGPVAHVFAGHIHRNITATVGSTPVTVFKSTCHQMPMLLGANGSHHSVDESSGYGIKLADGDSIVVHFEDVTPG